MGAFTDDVIRGTGRNLSSPHSLTACISPALQSTATACCFRKPAGIILLILQTDCWCFQQTEGQILCNALFDQKRNMTKYFSIFQFLDCPREVTMTFLTDDFLSFCLQQFPPSPDILSSLISSSEVKLLLLRLLHCQRELLKMRELYSVLHSTD